MSRHGAWHLIFFYFEVEQFSVSGFYSWFYSRWLWFGWISYIYRFWQKKIPFRMGKRENLFSCLELWIFNFQFFFLHFIVSSSFFFCSETENLKSSSSKFINSNDKSNNNKYDSKWWHRYSIFLIRFSFSFSFSLSIEQFPIFFPFFVLFYLDWPKIFFLLRYSYTCAHTHTQTHSDTDKHCVIELN